MLRFPWAPFGLFVVSFGVAARTDWATGWVATAGFFGGALFTVLAAQVFNTIEDRQKERRFNKRRYGE